MKNSMGIIQTLCCVGITTFLYLGSIQGNMVQEVVAQDKTETMESIVLEATPEPDAEAETLVKETEPPLILEAPAPDVAAVVEPVVEEVEDAQEGTDNGEYVDFAIADVQNYVNVRSKPTTDGDIVGKLYGGTVSQIVETAGEQNDWFQVISGNVEGYVKSEYFIHGEEALAVMDSYVVSYANVQVKKLNVRAGKSTGDKKIGYLESGESAKILENCGEWLKIQYTAETEGYIATEYVAISESYSYAKTPDEEKVQKAEDKEREARKPVQKEVVEDSAEEILEVIPPAVTYTSNEELRKEIINYALQFVGNKYINGGSSLTKGTDCSGFTCFIFKEFGYSISRTPSGQYSGAGRSIDISEIQPGDIVCYSSNGGKSCTHVAFYMGDGQIVHSANSRKGVITSKVDYEPIIGVRNVID